MSDDDINSQPLDASIPNNEPVATPNEEAAADAAPAEQDAPSEKESTEAPPEKPDAEKKTAWWMKEIGTVREKNQNLKTENETLKAQIEAYKASLTPAEGDAAKSEKALNPAEIDQLVNERAHQLKETESFNKTCNDIYSKGEEVFAASFKEAVESLNMLGALIDENNRPTPLLSVVTELKDAHKVLHHLAQNPEETQRIINLSPIKQALELTEIQGRLNAPSKAKPLSQAPDPIKPISSVSKGSPDLEKVDMKDYVAGRRKQREALGRRPLF